MHTYESLADDLAKSGIKRGDTLLVHSSMKSIGEVEGRADTVLDVFMDYFRDDGLFAMPTLTWSNVNAAQPIYDVRETKSVVGLLPELFRKREGVVRSLHPTHSLAAYGRNADAFTEGHERFDSPAGPFSPWRRLLLANAKIMFLGTGIGCNTFLHGVEEWGGAEEVLSIAKEQLVSIGYDGARHAVPSRRHIGDHSKFYHLLEPHFQALGALSEFRFGDALCKVLDARLAARYTLSLVKRFPRAFTDDWNLAHPAFFTETLAEDFPQARPMLNGDFK